MYVWRVSQYMITIQVHRGYRYPTRDMQEEEIVHIPVLLNQVLKYVKPEDNGIYLDCTVGMGGHALSILEQSSPNGILVGLDTDLEAIAAAKTKLADYTSRIYLFHTNYIHPDEVLNDLDIAKVDGILFDLGVSSLQLDRADRGRGVASVRDGRSQGLVGTTD